MGAHSFIALFMLLLLCCRCDALRFYIHDRERRCFQFEAPYGARVLGHRSIANGKGQAQLSLDIKSTTGTRVYESHSGDPKDAMFSFVTPPYHSSDEHYEQYDYEMDDQMATFDACVMLTYDQTMHAAQHGKRAVTFWVQLDHRAVKSDVHATTEGVTRITHSLSQMHSTLNMLLADLAALKMREQRLVKRTQRMALSLRNFAVLSIMVLMTVSYFQFKHYKKLFTAKKII